MDGVVVTSDTKRRNHAAWVGPLIALVGLVTYFTHAVKVPALRDTAALNLLVVSIGVAVAAWGVARRHNWKSWISLLAAGALACLLFGYVFVLSSQLPRAETAPPVGSAAPPLELPDQTGRLVSLENFPDQRTVVVFYRGFW
jgi:hypothetical protein